MNVLRVVFLALCAVFLVAALQLEQHPVASLTDLDVNGAPDRTPAAEGIAGGNGEQQAGDRAAGTGAGESSGSDKASASEKPSGQGNAGPGKSKKKAPKIDMLDGFAFTEAATVDGFLLRKGALYDVYSLRPVSAQSHVKLDVKKACPT